jgi:hypothetical protein
MPSAECGRLWLSSCVSGITAGSELPAASFQAARRYRLCEEVVEGLVGACGVAGGVEVLEQTADDGENDSRQFRSAETAHAFLEWCEPVGGRGPPEAGPEWFSRGVVQPAEHAEVRSPASSQSFKRFSERLIARLFSDAQVEADFGRSALEGLEVHIQAKAGLWSFPWRTDCWIRQVHEVQSPRPRGEVDSLPDAAS